MDSCSRSTSQKAREVPARNMHKAECPATSTCASNALQNCDLVRKKSSVAGLPFVLMRCYRGCVFLKLLVVYGVFVGFRSDIWIFLVRRHTLCYYSRPLFSFTSQMGRFASLFYCRQSSLRQSLEVWWALDYHCDCTLQLRLLFSSAHQIGAFSIEALIANLPKKHAAGHLVIWLTQMKKGLSRSVQIDRIDEIPWFWCIPTSAVTKPQACGRVRTSFGQKGSCIHSVPEF